LSAATRRLDKLKFEAVTIPSVCRNDTKGTVHALSAGTAGPKFEDSIFRKPPQVQKKAAAQAAAFFARGKKEER